MTRRRLALLAAVVTWVPLALFSIVQAGSADVRGADSFWRDVGVNARYLISVPLFILGDGICMPRLWRLIDHFTKAGLIGDVERFDAAVASARRAFDSRRALIGLCVVAWLAAAAIARSQPVVRVPAWHLGDGSFAPYSVAGWWHVLVSLPVALLLVFGWVWRVWVWAHLLHRIARCRLQLIASHPDRSGGVGFLGGSLRAFAPIGFAFSTIAASREAQVILSGPSSGSAHLYFNIGFAVFIMLLIVLPLCSFAPAIMEVGGRGNLSYSTLALQMGQAFERRWLTKETLRFGDDVLHAPDFSATVDLYSIVGGARGLRWVPVTRRHILTLVCVLAIPFLPVALLMVPLSVIWSQMRGLLF